MCTLYMGSFNVLRVFLNTFELEIIFLIYNPREIVNGIAILFLVKYRGYLLNVGVR